MAESEPSAGNACAVPRRLLFTEHPRGEKGIVGFLDLGQAGCADRWRDLDQGLWSMWAKTTGLFGGRARPFERNTLFSALNLPLDEEKLRYYSLLSELCP